jgi:hypothetical protein
MVAWHGIGSGAGLVSVRGPVSGPGGVVMHARGGYHTEGRAGQCIPLAEECGCSREGSWWGYQPRYRLHAWGVPAEGLRRARSTAGDWSCCVVRARCPVVCILQEWGISLEGGVLGLRMETCPPRVRSLQLRLSHIL